MIHQVPELCQFLDVSLERAREELVLHLKSYLVRHKVDIILVFDGDQPLVGIARLHRNNYPKILFSKYPLNADRVIKDLINKEDKKKGLTVVTDDGDIIRYAISHNAKSLSTSEFYNRLEKRFDRKELNNKFDQDLSEEELSEWLQIFGVK